MNIIGLLGKVVGLIAPGGIGGILGKLLPAVIERVAKDAPGHIVAGSPTYLQILETESIRNAVADGLAVLLQRWLPDATESPWGKFFKRLGDRLD